MMARRLQPPALDALPEEALVQTGGADQPVDDSGQCRHFAEGQAEQRGHEVEPGICSLLEFEYNANRISQREKRPT